MFYKFSMTGVEDNRKSDIEVIQKYFETCGIRVVSLWVVENVSALFLYLSINLSTLFTQVKRKIIHNS